MSGRSVRSGGYLDADSRAELAEWKRRIERRSRRANLTLEPGLSEKLSQYLALLTSWNKKINLTALDDRDAAVDRLVLEPLLASRQLSAATAIMDVGSGGGSPAIPMKLALPWCRLCMVESKMRKSAFLREAVRQLDLSEARVDSRRFEELLSLPAFHESFDVVSVRAVRVEGDTLRSLQAFVRPGGQILLFRGALSEPLDVAPPLIVEADEPLVESLRSRLVRLRKLEIG
jgi:16S rRNA (guanine527-N7)-methyltransferase